VRRQKGKEERKEGGRGKERNLNWVWVLKKKKKHRSGRKMRYVRKKRGCGPGRVSKKYHQKGRGRWETGGSLERG